MKRVFELNLDIFTSNYKEKILVEADNEIEAIRIMREKFHDFWCDYFSNNIFYEYKFGFVDEVNDIKSSKYKNLIVFSKNGCESIDTKNSEYGYNKNQLSIF